MNKKVIIIIGIVVAVLVVAGIGVLVYYKNNNSDSYDLSNDNERDKVASTETGGVSTQVDSSANTDLSALLQSYASGLSDLRLTNVQITNVDGTPYNIALTFDSTKNSNQSSYANGLPSNTIGNGPGSGDNTGNSGGEYGNSNQGGVSNLPSNASGTDAGVVNATLDFTLNTASHDKESIRHELENAANGLAVDIASAKPVVQKAVIHFNINGSGDIATLIYERDGSNMFLQEITLPDSVN